MLKLIIFLFDKNFTAYVEWKTLKKKNGRFCETIDYNELVV